MRHSYIGHEGSFPLIDRLLLLPLDVSLHTSSARSTRLWVNLRASREILITVSVANSLQVELGVQFGERFISQF